MTHETHFHSTLFSCFFTPQRIHLSLAFLSVGEDVSFMIILFSSLFTPGAFSCGFSFLRVGEDVFIHFFAACEGIGGGQPPPICNEGPPSKRAPRAISQGISFDVLEKMFLFL